MDAHRQYISGMVENAKDPDIFRLVRSIDTRHTLPAMMDGDTRVSTHGGFSDLIAAQLSPGEPVGWIDEPIDMEPANELEAAIRMSPGNTGPGGDDITYPLIRTWAGTDMESLRGLIDHALVHDIEDWHDTEVVLIPKADKPRYDVVKSWRMIHLLPTLAKVAERIVMMRLVKLLDLEDTQFGSRPGRGVHDAMALVYEFLEYNKGLHVAMLSMDVEGGFDNMNVDLLCDFMMARGCSLVLRNWVRRWARGRRMTLWFNSRVSKTYTVYKGVPQGSPLSPFLFGVYVADILRPRLLHTPTRRCVTSSYVDDGLILAAAGSREAASEMLVERFAECCRMAGGRGMAFSVLKTKWIGFGRTWNALEWDGHVITPVEEMRVLGFWFNIHTNFTAHVGYWLKRGMGARGRIGALGRRFGGSGGLGVWETLRLVRSLYLPTIYFGLEFLTGYGPYVKRIQVHLNDCLRSLFRAPVGIANSVLLAECSLPPVHIYGEYIRRRCYGRFINKKLLVDHPWTGCLKKDWGDDSMMPIVQHSDRELTAELRFNIRGSKEEPAEEHRSWIENWAGDPGFAIYTDGSKNPAVGRASVAWSIGEGGMDGVVKGLSVPGSWNIVECELFAMLCRLRELLLGFQGSVIVFSNCQPALKLLRNMVPNGHSAGLWNMFAEATARFTSVTFDWIPRHAGIHGNERVDKAARTAITQLENWRWDGLCFGIGQLAGCKEWLQTAWERWHIEGGRLYYNRKPKNTKHLRGLTRMEFYIILRLRGGVRGVRHGLCDIDPDERFHLRDCPIYATGRPEKHEIWNDKKISDWVHWMRIHFYLGCGVPMNHPEVDGHRVVAGNPFSRFVLVDDDGRLVVKPTPADAVFPTGQAGQASVKPGPAYPNSLRSSLARACRPG